MGPGLIVIGDSDSGGAAGRSTPIAMHSGLLSTRPSHEFIITPTKGPNYFREGDRVDTPLSGRYGLLGVHMENTVYLDRPPGILYR